MRNNVSKQILLSVIGVAILVIAVVGVSFALYIDLNYDNLAGPGSLFVQYEDEKKDFEITNSYPVSMEEGRTSGTKVTFKLNGTTDGYVIRVLADEGKNTLKDSEVFAYVSSEEVDGISFTPNGNFGTTGQALGSSDVILGEGSFKTNQKPERVFNIYFWVDDSVVSVGENGTYTPEAYANKSYSATVRVEVKLNK